VTQLPLAVHLVAETPHPDAVRLDRTVRDAPVGQFGSRAGVGVLQDVQCVEDSPGSEVDGVHELAVDLAQPGGELVEPDLVRLGGVPREVEASRTGLSRPDPVLPAITGDEVAPGVADGRDAELPDELDDVPPESVGVGLRMARFVDAVVDAPAEVFHEGSEEPAVDGPDDEVRVDGEVCRDHGSSIGRNDEGRGGW